MIKGINPSNQSQLLILLFKFNFNSILNEISPKKYSENKKVRAFQTWISSTNWIKDSIMELDKYQSLHDISDKPRNIFSQRALRFRVGEKRVRGTMSCIRIPSALVNSNLYSKTKSMETISKDKHKDYKGSLENVKKIDEEPDDDEKAEATGADKVKGFLIADEDSDGSSSSGDDGEKEEDDRKDAMELVDDDLKQLLVSFDNLERPSADEIKEKRVEFGPVFLDKRH